jgi:hypothetical protein
MPQRRQPNRNEEVERVEIADLMQDPEFMAGLSPESGRLPAHPVYTDPPAPSPQTPPYQDSTEALFGPIAEEEYTQNEPEPPARPALPAPVIPDQVPSRGARAPMRMEPHTIAAAMGRKELSREEAYFVLRFAGHMGYEKAMRRLVKHPLRHWLFWVGGWEEPELSQWDMGLPAWQPFRRIGDNHLWRSPFPLAFFGSRLVFHSGFIDVRCLGGVVVIHWRPSRGVYWSRTGQPHHKSTIQLIGRYTE